MDIVNRAPLTYGRLVQHAFWIRLLKDHGREVLPELRALLEEYLERAYELGRGLEAEAEEARERFNNQAPGALGVNEIVEGLKLRANQIVDGLFQDLRAAHQEGIAQILEQPPRVDNRRRAGYLSKLQNILSLRYFQWIEEGENRRVNFQDLMTIAARASDGVRRVVMDLAERRRWRAQQNPGEAMRGNPVALVDERINAAAVFIFDSFEFVIRENRLARVQRQNAVREARRERWRQETQRRMEVEARRMIVAHFGWPVGALAVPFPAPENVIFRPGILRRRPEDLNPEQEAPQEAPLGHAIVRPEPIRGVPPVVRAGALGRTGQEQSVWDRLCQDPNFRNLFVNPPPAPLRPITWQDVRIVETIQKMVEETRRSAREKEALLNGTREEMIEHREQIRQKIEDVERQLQQTAEGDYNNIFFGHKLQLHLEEMKELDEHFARKYPHIPVPTVVEGSFPICLKKCYQLICKFREINLKEQLENTARGLPEQNIFIFNPLEVFHTMMKLFESPETTKELGVEKFFDDVQKMADKADEQPVEPSPMPHRLPGQFQLPSHIRERLSVREVQVIENSMDHLRKSMVDGTDFPTMRELQVMIDAARSNGRADEILPEGRLIEVMEKAIVSDEYKERAQIYEMNKRDKIRRAPDGVQPSKVYREPESRHLYTPYISKTDYDLWTEKDVYDWIRHFVHDQKHRDLIDVRRFDGPCLYSFLDSNTEWKKAGWPFGLFVRVKGHFNRVVNGENQHFQSLRIDDF